jgi:hypothetical protein
VGDVGGFGSGGGFGGILFAPGNSATALKQIMDNAKRWAWAGKGRPKRGHLPSDAIRCTAGGVSFWAPPSFNVPEIYLAGEEGGSTGVSEGYAAVGQAGEFDFQRSVDLAGNPVFISSYTNASNFAVGAYLAGAGYGQASGGAISNTYAFFRSSNFGDPKQAQFRNLGMDVASGRLRLNCRR